MILKVLDRVIFHSVPKITKISILDIRIGDLFWKFQSLIQLLSKDNHIGFFST